MKAQKWILSKAFEGTPNEKNLTLVDFEVREELEDGEVLCQAVYLTVDPYMRIFPTPVGQVMFGEQLSEVLKSKNGKYPVGSLVMSKAGWQSHYISDGTEVQPGDGPQAVPDNSTKIPIAPIRFDLGSTPISYTLGTLGMPGASAYFALNKCEPQPGETILITSAAGAVGHVVGQLAKLKGLTVIGVAGSDEKCAWLRDDLKFDHVFNYKTQDVFAELKKKSVVPQSVDIYFDNVGGDYYNNMVTGGYMNRNGRVLICGSISAYNEQSTPKLYPLNNLPILMSQLSIHGFMVMKYEEEYPVAFTEMNKLIQSGELKVRETVLTGFDKMRDAFFNIFKGDSIGKQVVKCVNTTTNYA